jgi:hypothetical protein
LLRGVPFEVAGRYLIDVRSILRGAGLRVSEITGSTASAETPSVGKPSLAGAQLAPPSVVL